MDIEKLIEQLHNFEACAYGYHINGEVLGVDCSDFEQVMVDAAEEISKIPTLQAENERLKNKLSELAHLPFDEPGIGERTRLMAENAELRAELEQVKRALAMMWFAYVNSDKETPHSYETEALVEAEHILGPWSECMPIYLSRGQKEE